METNDTSHKPHALTLLASERPRNVGWLQAAGFLFGDWGTSRLYVLGLALFFAGRTSFWLIVLMSLLILAVGWAYSQICRIYPDGGGVYTAAKQTSRTLAVVGALLLFADYTVTASLSVLDAFHYFGLPLHKPTLIGKRRRPSRNRQIAGTETVRHCRSSITIPTRTSTPATLLDPKREQPAVASEETSSPGIRRACGRSSPSPPSACST